MKNWVKALITAAVTLACFMLAAFSHLIILPIIGLAAYMGVYWGLGYVVPVIAALVGGTLVFAGADPGAVCYAVMLALLPVTLVIYGKRRLPHRYALLALAVLLCLGNYLSVALVPLLNGEAPYSAISEAWDGVVVESFKSVFTEELAGYSGMLELLNSFTELLPNMFMPSIVFSAEFCAMALIFGFRLWHKVFRTEPAPMARFHNWRLPQSSIIGAIVLVVGIILVYVFKVQQATAIALTFGVIIVSLFSVQGLAYLMFVLRITKAPKIMRVLLWVIAALLMPYSLILLATIGFTEQIQKKRRRVLEYMKQESQRSRLERRAEEYAKYGYIREDEPEKKDDPEEDEKEE